jgi:hypothetical protein
VTVGNNTDFAMTSLVRFCPAKIAELIFEFLLLAQLLPVHLREEEENLAIPIQGTTEMMKEIGKNLWDNLPGPVQTA